MKNLSLGKIIAALLICNIYLFVCGVTGTVNNSETNGDAINSAISDGEDEAHGFGTQDFISSDLMDITHVSSNAPTVSSVFGTPSLESKPVNMKYIPSELMKQLQEEMNSSDEEDSDLNTEPDDDFDEPNDELDNSEATPSNPTQTTKPDPEPEDTSETETPPTPTQPSEIVTNTDAANEIITVNDSGDIVSGKAIDIVSRIVMNEIGGAFAPEAIKAQAVAAYTYVKYHNSRGSYPSVILSDTVPDSIRVLVSSVIGEAVYYDGELIQAVYSASSAGCTASSKSVWGVEYPYLTSVYCELDASYDPNYGRKVTFSSADMKARVYSSTGISLSGDPSKWFSIVDRTEGKYVGNMTVGGYSTYIDSDGDDVKITGRIFRERIMSFDIRSNAFDISYDTSSDLFTITTYGYGHGVGLSQNGANALATYMCWDYKQILEFYYPSAYVQ